MAPALVFFLSKKGLGFEAEVMGGGGGYDGYGGSVLRTRRWDSWVWEGRVKWTAGFVRVGFTFYVLARMFRAL